MTLDEIAETCHEANRVLQRSLDEPVNPPWAEAGVEMRDSARDGVTSALAGTTPEQSHANWVEFKVARGWTWGRTKDTANKTHPCIMPYENLPPDQQVKDELFTRIVVALTPLYDPAVD